MRFIEWISMNFVILHHTRFTEDKKRKKVMKSLEINKTTKEIYDIAGEIMKIYRDRLKNLGRSTDVANDWIITYDNKSFEISLNEPDYWIYAENGRRAGKQPPVEDILSWIKIKHIIPRSRGGEVPSQESLAYMIARSIGRKGVPARQPWKRSLTEAVNNGVMEDLEEAITNYIVEFLWESISQSKKIKSKND